MIHSDKPSRSFGIRTSDIVHCFFSSWKYPPANVQSGRSRRCESHTLTPGRVTATETALYRMCFFLREKDQTRFAFELVFGLHLWKAGESPGVAETTFISCLPGTNSFQWEGQHINGEESASKIRRAFPADFPSVQSRLRRGNTKAPHLGLFDSSSRLSEITQPSRLFLAMLRYG